MSPSLSREEILAAIAARKAEVEEIDVPEWGGKVYGRRLSSGDVEKTGFFDEGAERPADMTVRMVIACLTDEEGTALFTEEDIAQVSEADFPVVMRLFGEVMKINGLKVEDLDEALASFGEAQRAASSSS